MFVPYHFVAGRREYEFPPPAPGLGEINLRQVKPETKQAVVVRFNNPVRILNQYEPGRPIGAAGAGISWRIPIAEQLVWIDKRVQDAYLGE